MDDDKIFTFTALAMVCLALAFPVLGLVMIIMNLGCP